MTLEYPQPEEKETGFSAAEAARGGLRPEDVTSKERAAQVRNFLLRVTQSQLRGSHAAEAENFAHEAYLLALKHLGSFNGTGPFEAWLSRIAVNVVKGHFRTASSRLTDQFNNRDFAVEERESPYDEEERAMVRDGIKRLSETLREVARLSFVEGLSMKEISGKTGLSEKTVKARLHRARLVLKKYILFKIGKSKINPEPVEINPDSSELVN